MKILQVVHQFLPRHIAGSEIFTYELSRELKSLGHSIRIFCQEESSSAAPVSFSTIEYRGLTIHKYFQSPYRGFPISKLRQYAGIFRHRSLQSSFTGLLDSFQPDVVHIQHLAKLPVSLTGIIRNRRIPVIMTLHDYLPICHRITLLDNTGKVCSGPDRGYRCASCLAGSRSHGFGELLTPFAIPCTLFRTWYIKKMLNHVDLFVSPSRYLKRVMTTHGMDPARIQVSGYGINYGYNIPLRKTPGPPIRFGFIGKIMKHKGLHLLIDAFNRLDDNRARLNIYGDESDALPYYDHLKNSVRSGKIRFRGRYEHEGIGRILAECDVIIVPSTWPENAPFAILEAYSARIPVIASHCGGLMELVRDGIDGFLFEMNNPEDLVKKIMMIIEDPPRIELLRNRIRRVKSIRENAREYLDLYTELILRLDSPHTVDREALSA